MADSENWDGRVWGTSTSRKFSEVIDNRPLRIRTVGGVEGAEDQKSSPLSDHSPSLNRREKAEDSCLYATLGRVKAGIFLH